MLKRAKTAKICRGVVAYASKLALLPGFGLAELDLALKPIAYPKCNKCFYGERYSLPVDYQK